MIEQKFTALRIASLIVALFACLALAWGNDHNSEGYGDPKRGFDFLINKPYTPPVMKIEELESLWKVWEPEWRKKAENASPESRREMIFKRYGLIERDFDDSGLPLGYTADGNGNLVNNCFQCHGGRVAGKTIPGAGNAYQDMSSLFEDIERLRAMRNGTEYKGTRADQIDNFVLNYQQGGTNAFVLSVLLTTFRDKDMKTTFPHQLGEWVSHDEDAPPWWHYKKKDRVYWTAMGPKTARILMQFVTTPNNSAEELQVYEKDFEDIHAYINELEAPAYPYAIDEKLAAKGKPLFEEHCAKCHGAYGETETYPNKVVPLDRIKTDPVRLTALPKEWKEFYNKSWMTHYGEHPLTVEPEGYLAPPLDGVWATAPYFHNGSVPTLYHVFNPDERPDVWTRSMEDYDQERVGLVIEEHESIPEGLLPHQRRAYYDVSVPGAGNEGHYFPDEFLNAEEKTWVIEYLKTL